MISAYLSCCSLDLRLCVHIDSQAAVKLALHFAPFGLAFSADLLFILEEKEFFFLEAIATAHIAAETAIATSLSMLHARGCGVRAPAVMLMGEKPKLGLFALR